MSLTDDSAASSGVWHCGQISWVTTPNPSVSAFSMTQIQPSPGSARRSPQRAQHLRFFGRRFDFDDTSGHPPGTLAAKLSEQVVWVAAVLFLSGPRQPYRPKLADPLSRRGPFLPRRHA